MAEMSAVTTKILGFTGEKLMFMSAAAAMAAVAGALTLALDQNVANVVNVADATSRFLSHLQHLADVKMRDTPNPHSACREYTQSALTFRP